MCNGAYALPHVEIYSINISRYLSFNLIAKQIHFAFSVPRAKKKEKKKKENPNWLCHHDFGVWRIINSTSHVPFPQHFLAEILMASVVH